MSQPSARTCATQLIGSIVAWARNGTSYSASIRFAAPARALAACSTELEVVRRLELGLLRHSACRRRGRQLAVAERAARPFVPHYTVRRAARCRVHAPLLGGGADQHLARGGPGLAQVLPRR